MSNVNTSIATLAIAYVGSIVTAVAAWLTHVVYCIATGKIGLLLVGAIAFPIGIIHGLGIWFGFWR